MGVNLVTRVRNFQIGTEAFASDSHDVQDGCVTPGNHRVLRFDFLSHNVGNADMVIGSPAARPDLFVWSAGHGHYHMKDFNQFLLFTRAGSLAMTGYKQAFCAIDIEPISSTASPSGRFHDCNANQGISAGWADVYHAGLACQFIVVDGLPDGDYTLQSTTNTQHKAAEDCFGDNTIWTGLRIVGNTVNEIAPPFIPEDRIAFNRANVAAVQVGGRWKVAEGSHWMIDTGTNEGLARRAVEIINHYKLSSMCFVGRPRCGDVEPMMYWLTDAGRAPSGNLAGEDRIPFDPAHLEVKQIGDRWKVVEGTHWLLDFGPGQGNAIAALHFIKKHKFTEMCFVGRPHPPMTYFKARGRRDSIVVQIDPRVIEAAIDHPRWWTEQAVAVAELAPSVDFSDECIGARPARRQSFGPITVEMADDDQIDIVERHNIRGLAVGSGIEIHLGEKASVVDVGVAHFGTPPTITAYAGKKRTVEVRADPIPRQFANLRLIGPSIDRIVIGSSDDAEQQSVLGYVRFQPKTRLSKRAAAQK
jgi:hypothetical protein